MSLVLSAEAQQHLDAANALFPGRYRLEPSGPYFTGVDLFRGRYVAVEDDPVKAARKTLASARRSVSSPQRRYAEGERPQTRFLKLPPAQWQRIEQYARERGLRLEDLLLSLL